VRHFLLISLLAACGGAADPAPAPEPVPEAAPAPVAAPPPVASASGRVSVTTIKKETVEDVHTLDVEVSTLKVGTAWDPSTITGSLTVRADTWASPIALRDTRVKELFFDAAAHPTVTLEVTSVEGFGPLAPGAKAEGVVNGSLVVLTGRIPVSAKVAIARGAAGLDVAVLEPVVVSAAALGLGDRLKAVSDACAVPLADVAKVTAAFTIPQP
jgi:hypothetical protein